MIVDSLRLWSQTWSPLFAPSASMMAMAETDIECMHALLVAESLIQEHPEPVLLAMAQGYYETDEVSSRLLATLLLGELMPTVYLARYLLREVVSLDPSRLVQRGLGMAFDIYCDRVGYEAALPEIADWLADDRVSVRLAVIEGLGDWIDRPYFAMHPLEAIEMLGWVKDDRFPIVRHAAADVLRAIGKSHPQLIVRELNSWDLRHPAAAETFAHVLGGRISS